MSNVSMSLMAHPAECVGFLMATFSTFCLQSHAHTGENTRLIDSRCATLACFNGVATAFMCQEAVSGGPGAQGAVAAAAIFNILWTQVSYWFLSRDSYRIRESFLSTCRHRGNQVIFAVGVVFTGGMSLLNFWHLDTVWDGFSYGVAMLECLAMVGLLRAGPKMVERLPEVKVKEAPRRRQRAAR